MAKNLRLKVPKEDTFVVFDVNAASSEALVKELGAERVKVASDVREVAEESVSNCNPFCFFVCYISL
jgi:hypothetical protein